MPSAITVELSPGHRIKPTLAYSTGCQLKDFLQGVMVSHPRPHLHPHPLLHEQLVLVSGQALGEASGVQPALTYK